MVKYKELVELLQVLPEEQGKQYIVDYLSNDESIISNMLMLIEAERRNKKELIEDMNLNLTRNTTGLMFPEICPVGSPEKQRQFYINETHKFYKRYEDQVRTAGMKLWDDVK